jgi:hypothetical protein
MRETVRERQRDGERETERQTETEREVRIGGRGHEEEVLEVLFKVCRKFWQISSMKVAIIRTLASNLRPITGFCVWFVEGREEGRVCLHSNLAMKM